MELTQLREKALEVLNLGRQMQATFDRSLGAEMSDEYMILAIMGGLQEMDNKKLPPLVSGKFFYDLRKRNKLTLRRVENEAGFKTGYLSQLETGKIVRPSFEIVMKLLTYYKYFD